MELCTVNIILGKANMANVLSALQVSFMKDDIIVVFYILFSFLFIIYYALQNCMIIYIESCKFVLFITQVGFWLI